MITSVLEIETQNENLDIVPESNYCNLDLNPSRHAIIQGPTFSYASLVSKAVETVPKSKKLVSKTKQDKLLEKAVKAAETANKRFNKATECLKVLTLHIYFLISRFQKIVMTFFFLSRTLQHCLTQDY